MRTNYTTLFLVLLFCLVGCNDSDKHIDLTTTDQIRLSVSYDEAFTRGTPLADSNQMSTMGVFAYYTGLGADNWESKGVTATPNFMNHQKVNNEGVNTGGSYWQYSPTLYWPPQKDANITFLAYAPYANNSNGISIINTTGGLTLNYNVPTECANQPDLMLAPPQTDLNITHNGAINFNMQHALTCIGFSAIGSGISIKSIQLTNVVTSGQVKVDPTTGGISWKLGAAQSSFDAIPNNVTLEETLQDIITSNGYLMMVPQTLGSNAKLVVTDSNGTTTTFNLSGQVWKAGQKINYNLNLNEDPASITIDQLPNAFVGAYWRYNETGERIIRMNNTGAWEVSVLATDSHWEKSDIMLGGLPSYYSSTIGVAIAGGIEQMTTSVATMSGTDNISFRVGLREGCTLATAKSKPRYAILLIKYGTTPRKNHLIFLRQGEAPDVVNGTAEFSPYNLAYELGTESEYDFADYPTKSGGFKTWSTSTNMYSPYGVYAGTIRLGSTANIANICPDNYKIPSSKDFYQLLASTDNTTSQYTVGGLYADGYYDRSTINMTSDTYEGTYQVGTGNNVAFGGFLVYNMETYASVFFPEGGRRTMVSTTPLELGDTGYYWSTTQNTHINEVYYLQGVRSLSNGQKTNVSVSATSTKQQAFCIRPVSRKAIEPGEDIDGSLDGFGDEDGWE